ncbi:MAG TPA: hypothetical protein VMF69_06750 [Gemmataceae bacterium]|nr:hypothetical protein [Gemmataceae bacterium]
MIGAGSDAEARALSPEARNEPANSDLEPANSDLETDVPGLRPAPEVPEGFPKLPLPGWPAALAEYGPVGVWLAGLALSFYQLLEPPAPGDIPAQKGWASEKWIMENIYEKSERMNGKKPELRTPCSASEASESRRTEAKVEKAPGKGGDGRKCPPHNWVEKPDEPGHTVDNSDPKKSEASLKEGLQPKSDLADTMLKSPTRDGPRRGYEFEVYAALLNHKKKPIARVGQTWFCTICGAKQEVDIEFGDGQLAEAKSASYNKVKRRTKEDPKSQLSKLLDLQRQFNSEKGTSFPLMSKIDMNHPEAAHVKAELERRKKSANIEIEEIHSFQPRSR